MSEDHVEFVAKAAVGGYVIVGTCFGMPAILAAPVVLLRPEVAGEWLPILYLGLGAVALAFSWLGAFRLQVGNRELTYRTLLNGESRVPLNEIRAVRRVLEFNPWKDWGKPRNRLDIFVEAKGSKTPHISINAKVFRKRDIEFLLHLIETNLRAS